MPALELEIDASGMRRGAAEARRAIESIQRGLGQTRRETSRTARGFTDFGRVVRGALAGIGVGLILRDALRAIDTYQQLQNRLRTVTDTSEELTRVQADLFRASQATRTSYEANVELYARLARSTRDLGLEQQDVLRITESINQAVILSGAASTEATGAIRQLSQAFNKGKLDGEEFRSVAEQLPIVLELVARELGVSRGELDTLREQGVITSEVIVRAFQNAREELADRFGETLPTISQQTLVLRDQWRLFVNELDSGVGVGTFVVDVLGKLSEVLRLLRGDFDGLSRATRDWAVDVVTAYGEIEKATQTGRSRFLDFIFTPGRTELFRRFIVPDAARPFLFSASQRDPQEQEALIDARTNQRVARILGREGTRPLTQPGSGEGFVGPPVPLRLIEESRRVSGFERLPGFVGPERLTPERERQLAAQRQQLRESRQLITEFNDLTRGVRTGEAGDPLSIIADVQERFRTGFERLPGFVGPERLTLERERQLAAQRQQLRESRQLITEFNDLTRGVRTGEAGDPLSIIADVQERFRTGEPADRERVVDIQESITSEIEKQNAAIRQQRQELVLATAQADVLLTPFFALEDALLSIVDGTRSVKEAFEDMGRAILSDLTRIITRLITILAIETILGFVDPSGLSTFARSTRAALGTAVEAQGGGIFSGPASGYPVILHGTERVDPLNPVTKEPLRDTGGSGGRMTIVHTHHHTWNVNTIDARTFDSYNLDSIARNKESVAENVADELGRNPSLRQVAGAA